jgi:hypothetical protein
MLHTVTFNELCQSTRRDVVNAERNQEYFSHYFHQVVTKQGGIFQGSYFQTSAASDTSTAQHLLLQLDGLNCLDRKSVKPCY